MGSRLICCCVQWFDGVFPAKVFGSVDISCASMKALKASQRDSKLSASKRLPGLPVCRTINEKKYL